MPRVPREKAFTFAPEYKSLAGTGEGITVLDSIRMVPKNRLLTKKYAGR
jgi:hypothetical protein